MSRHIQDIVVALDTLAEKSLYQRLMLPFIIEELMLQEVRNGLEEAKDAVVNYIATQWNVKNPSQFCSITRCGRKIITVIT